MHRAVMKVIEVPVTMKESDGSPPMHSGIRVLYYVYKMTLSILIVRFRTV